MYTCTNYKKIYDLWYEMVIGISHSAWFSDELPILYKKEYKDLFLYKDLQLIYSYTKYFYMLCWLMINSITSAGY